MGVVELVKRYGFIVILFVAFIVGFYALRQDDVMVAKTDEVESMQVDEHFLETEIENENSEPKAVIVDIKGEVHHPGVYEVNNDARIVDVVSLAGGFTDKADELQVNLAQIVEDEMVIYIPEVGSELVIPGSTTTTGMKGSSQDGVNINHASQEELETLPGIGPSKAQAIIQYREENGPFQTKEDLLQVNGIGEKTLENMEEMVIVP